MHETKHIASVHCCNLVVLLERFNAVIATFNDSQLIDRKEPNYYSSQRHS